MNSLKGVTKETPLFLVHGIELVIQTKIITLTQPITSKEFENNSKISLDLVLQEISMTNQESRWKTKNEK